MAGFDNNVMYADNVDYRGVEDVTGQITAAGQLSIGTGSSPAIATGSITSPDSSITVGYSSPNVTLIANGASVGKTITGNTGSAASPIAGNWNIVTANSTVKFNSLTPTITQDFGLTNICLGTSMPALTTANSCVGVGYQTLLAVTSASGSTAFGYQALKGVTSGLSNTCIGGLSGVALTTGLQNTALGESTLFSCLNSIQGNVAIGYHALISSHVDYAIGIGYNAMAASLSGVNNIGIGREAYKSLTTGANNTACGYQTGQAMIDGGSNSFFGSLSGYGVQHGDYNTGYGTQTMYCVTGTASFSYNTFCGYNGGAILTTGNRNTGVGAGAFSNLLTGAYNIGIGFFSTGGNYTAAESSNILIGNDGTGGESNIIRIGTQGSSSGQQTDCYLAGVLHTTSGRTRNITAPGAYPYTVLSTDDIISVNTASAHTINLPNAPTSGTVYVLKDVTGSAASNNISVTTPGGTVTIDGSTTYVMSTNYASISVYFNGSNYFII